MKHRRHILLAIIFILSLFMRLFRLGLDGFSNLYYAATVRSMLTGWHNFFFASFDPAGFVSVDKPPLGFWIQALSAAVFGFHGWALILPQALAGALSVIMMYVLVKRIYGSEAGLVAALIMAITPISVATHRSNTPDGQLILLLLLAALFASKAAETGKLRWLAASAALVGIGFNVKMLQAYMVIPALFLFLPPPIPIIKRVGQLAVAMMIVLGLSFAWPMAVDSTPATARPYVGSTVTNHVFELVAVHNGVRRLGPIAGWFGIHPKDSAVAAAPTPADGTPASAPQPPTQASISTAQTGSARAWPDGGLAEVGEPGPLRLFNPELAAQASWLLPLALLALLSGILRTPWKQPLSREALFYILWAGWLIPAMFFFSFGGLIHRYYLDMLDPPVAALSAVGLVSWKKDVIGTGRTRWLLPAAIALTDIVALFFLGYYPAMRWLFPPVLLLGMLGVLSTTMLRSRLRAPWMWSALLPALLLCPLVWSTTPMWKGGDVILPFAGPDLVYWGGEGNVLQSYRPLAQFLEKQHENETFIVATGNAVVAAPIQILTGQAVMAMGGFTGADPILTDEKLAQFISHGNLRFLLAYHEDPIRTGSTAWAAANCELAVFEPVPEGMDLYDCRPAGK